MTNQSKNENSPTQGSQETLRPEIGSGLKQTSIGRFTPQIRVSTSGFGDMRSNPSYNGSAFNNKTLNNQINSLTRTFLIGGQIVNTQSISKGNRLGPVSLAKQKGLVSNQLSNGNYVLNLRCCAQKKYDLLMSVSDKQVCEREASKTNAQLLSWQGIGSPVDAVTPQAFSTQRVLLKKPSFLAYWLLPFLGLIPGNALGQDKGLASQTFMWSNNDTLLVSGDMSASQLMASSNTNKLDKLALNTTLFRNKNRVQTSLFGKPDLNNEYDLSKAMPKPEQKNVAAKPPGGVASSTIVANPEDVNPGINKLVRFYLKELETNYTDQKSNFKTLRSGVKPSTLVTVAIPKEGLKQSVDANLNFVLSVSLKRNQGKALDGYASNLDILVANKAKQDPREKNTLSLNNLSGQASPKETNPGTDNVLLLQKKATFKIRPNSSYAYLTQFSNKKPARLLALQAENEMFLASKGWPKRTELVGDLNRSSKSITLKSNYLPFSLETAPVYDKGNLSFVGRAPRTVVSQPYLQETTSQVNFSIPRVSLSLDELKKENTFDLGLTFANYLKYLKSRIALVSGESQKSVGNRGFSKATTTIGRTSFTPSADKLKKESAQETSVYKFDREQRKTLVGLNLVKTSLVIPNNKIVAKDGTTLNNPAKQELRFIRTQNAITILLNHKKFNHISKLKVGEVSQKVSSTLANPSVEEELVYITKKKDLQKKHKAKKQRLESRRQKKRKRFYPRPTWLRLRLGLSMSDRRSDLTIRENPTRLRLSSAPRLQEVVDLKQRLSSSAVLTSWTKRPVLNNSRYATPKGDFAASVRINKLVNNRSKWQKTLNSTAYNQIVYNLIVSKNLLNTRFTTAENSLKQPSTVSLQRSAEFLADGNDLSNKSTKPSNLFIASVSFYKSENKVLSDFVYRKKPPTELYPISSFNTFSKQSLRLSRAQIKKLIQIKNNANYVNFERKSNNQTTPTKETNSSVVKDFWVWVYNLTNRNSYNKTLLVDTVLNHLSVPINLSKHSRFIAERNDKVLFSNSETNKKALKLASWAFNQTNLLSSTNKRLNIWATLKLRNQSKNNKTKYIEKKVKKQLNSSLSPFVLKNLAKLEVRNQYLTDNKLNVNFGKLASRITNKMHQKEQKLAFITNMSGSSTLAKSKSQRGLTYKLGSEPFSNIMALSKSRNSLNNVTLMPSLDNKKIFAGLRRNISRTQLSASSNRASQIEPKFMDNVNWWRHPQGRVARTIGLPISNLDIMSSTGEPFAAGQLLPEGENFLVSNGPSFALATIGLLFHFCALISLISISQLRCFIKFHLILLHKLSNGYLQVLFKTSSVVQKYLRTSVMSLSLLVSPSQIYLTKNSLLKKSGQDKVLTTTTFLKSLASKNQVIISTLSTPTIRNVGRNNISNKTDYANKTSIISNSSKSASIKQGSGNQAFRKVLFDKPFKLAPLNLSNLASKDKAISNPLTGVYGNSTVANLNISSQKEYRELVLKNLQILQIEKQITTWRYTKETVNRLKKDTLNTGFKVVDTFESFLRIIYGIFEKPYEFTMDCIAYAFLVEWSSDVLSYTPQNHSAGGAQAKNWSTFAKLVNQNQLNLLFYTKQLVASSAQSVSTKINMPSQNLVLLGLSTVALSQFLTKRILYLNDCFLTVLYRPDTDLILRQRKGTLFWDIWSDFLLKAADKYNINVPSLSNIKEEQNVLLENFLSDSTLISVVHPREQNSTLVLNQVNLFIATISTLSNVYGFKTFKLEQSTPGSELQKNKFNGIYGTAKALLKSNTTRVLAHPEGLNSLSSRGNLDYLNLAQQSITYQSKETDLFLEYHPPKSFSHISAIKYYSLVQQPIGSLVCQIYSGILEKQIAKNVLVIGSTLSSNSASSGSAAGFESMQKTLLIQALAGETEMKMITDNASRYAVVSRGFAVGIKYLKEVFEAITLNTPCLFLLEDIHLIGERRPQLISDHGDAFGSADGMSKATDANFGSQHSGGAAVHEKNQISYQLSRHSIADYKKPFKGDFSLAIPSNHFSFDFFLKSSSNTGGPFANFSAIVTHPLANSSTTQSIFAQETSVYSGDHSGKQDSKSSLAVMNKKLTSKRNLSSVGQDALGSSQKVLSSSLQLTSAAAKNSLLSPPSTSPFSVLLLKEQKKLKAKKIVKELPWIGLPSGSGGTQQVALLPRVSYSVRAKVSALAELGFSSMSAKLDMITDLLVIIDSVRGHRGFVVFATTHLPHILDPALRRPGRLDETISIPTLSNLWTRWEFSKTSLNPITSNNKQRFVNTNGYISNKPLGLSYKGTLDATDFINLDFLVAQSAHGDPALRAGGRAKQATYGSQLKAPSGTSVKKGIFFEKSESGDIGAYKDRVFDPRGAGSPANKQKYITKLRHVAYYQMGKKLFSSGSKSLLPSTGAQSVSKFELINKADRAQSVSAVPPFNLSSFSPVYLNPTTYESVNTLTESSEFMLHYGPEALKYKSLYMSPKKGADRNSNSESFGINNVLVTLMGGKFTEFFASTSLRLLKDSNTTKSTATASTVESRNNKVNLSLASETLNKGFVHSPRLMAGISSPGTNKPFISNPELTKNLIKANFISLYGIDQTWRAATSFTLSLVQKRYLFNKNLVVPKLLNFLNFGPLEEAPSPPSSNILVPAKRFENAKKGFKETIQYKLFGISTALIQDKLESHKKQGYIRNIFNTSSATDSLAQQKSGLSALSTQGKSLTNQPQKSYAEGPLLQITSDDVYKNKLLLPTSASSLYQNKILNRHKIGLNNQWWNGLLTEHTAETLFLSDIDWRYTFIQDYNSPELYQKQQQFFAKLRYNASSGYTASRQGLTSESSETFLGKAHTRGADSHQSQDVVIDFPDADQYYNPKQRRWFVTSGYWNSWFNVNQDLQTEVFDYLIFESIITSFHILNNNRELLDYAVSKFIKTGLIKETNYKILLKKFS